MMSQKDLEQQAAKHKEHSPYSFLKLRSLELNYAQMKLKNKKEVKTQDLEDAGQETEASNFSQLEQQEENAKLITALMRAEEAEAKLQQTLQDNEEERKKIIGPRSDEEDSIVKKAVGKKSTRKRRCLVRLFTSPPPAGRSAELFVYVSNLNTKINMKIF